MPVKQQYKVLKMRRIDGTTCAVDDQVSLHPRQAAFLLTQGVVALVEGVKQVKQVKQVKKKDSK